MNGTLGAIDLQVLRGAEAAVRARWPSVPSPAGGMILGSGWGEVAAAWEEVGCLSYDEIPGLGRPGVAGHVGRLSRVRLGNGGELWIFQGRRHWYEGVGWTPVAIPIHLLRTFGARRCLLTNAAGGIAPHLVPGRLMAIADHIFTAGWGPLVGGAPPEWAAPTFPDMTETYSASLRARLKMAADACGIELAEGVYAAVAGPQYETPAEVRALRALGADAVGMSTAPEALLARAAGIEVAAVSCISNAAAGLAGRILDHAEVLEVLREAAGNAARLLKQFWEIA